MPNDNLFPRSHISPCSLRTFRIHPFLPPAPSVLQTLFLCRRKRSAAVARVENAVYQASVEAQRLPLITLCKVRASPTMIRRYDIHEESEASPDQRWVSKNERANKVNVVFICCKSCHQTMLPFAATANSVITLLIMSLKPNSSNSALYFPPSQSLAILARQLRKTGRSFELTGTRTSCSFPCTPRRMIETRICSDTVQIPVCRNS